MRYLKVLGVLLAVLLVLNFFLFVFGKIGNLLFWVTIAVIAIIAYKVIPLLKK